jgi:hypothetical protein
MPCNSRPRKRGETELTPKFVLIQRGQAPSGLPTLTKHSIPSANKEGKFTASAHVYAKKKGSDAKAGVKQEAL